VVFFFPNRKYLVSATGILYYEWGPTTYIIINSNCKAKDLIREKLKWAFSFSECICAARVGLRKKREREREFGRMILWRSGSEEQLRE
jgi:hypothetical protein